MGVLYVEKYVPGLGGVKGKMIQIMSSVTNVAKEDI